jgi:hypothetical protein
MPTPEGLARQFEAHLALICAGGLADARVRERSRGFGLLSRPPDGRLFSVIGFTIARGSIVEEDILADPGRLKGLDLSAIESRALSEARRQPSDGSAPECG